MRIRTIKPEFFLHDGLWEAEQAEKLPLRIAFIGIWCAADREGRFAWEPRRLGVAILPYDQVDFSRVLHALTTRGFIVKYRVNDRWFGVIPSFSKHQVINNREADSVIPSPDDAQEVATLDDACPTRAPRVTHASKEERKGKAGNKERKEGVGSAHASPCEDALLLDLPPKKERPRDPLFDAFASATDGDPRQLTKEAAKACAIALAEVRKVAPDLTPQEIHRRAANYRAHFKDASCTAFALAKHWARCDSLPSGTSTTPRWQPSDPEAF